ncbi:hypothetical protein LCGC14_2086460, partial [marine sediment metagenome]
LKLGGRGLAAGFWAARQFSDSYEDLKEMGASDKQALSIGAGIAAGTGVIEQFVPDPIGLLKNKGIAGAAIHGLSKSVQRGIGKVGLKKLKHPLAKRTAGQAAGALGRTAGEIFEEGTEAAFDEAVKFNLATRDEAIAERDVSDIGTRAVEAMVEAGPGILALGGGGAVVGTGEQASRFKRKAKGLQQAKVEKEIMRFAESGETPTRTQWSKWGALDVEGHSQKTRKTGVKAIARRLQQSAQAQTMVDRVTPTEQQWKDWGFDPKEGATEESRREHLFERFRGGYAAIQAEQEPSKAPEALEGVPSQTEALDALQPAPVATETVQVAPETEELSIGAQQVPPVSTTEVSEPPSMSKAAESVQTSEQVIAEPVEAPETRITDKYMVRGNHLFIKIQGKWSRIESFNSNEEAQRAMLDAEEVSESPTIQTDEVDITDSVKKTDSAIGNFIQDSAGRIGIDVEKVGRGLKKAKGIGQRLALSRGELPQSIFEAKTRTEGFEAKIETRLRFAVNKFRKIEKKVFGEDGMNGKDTATVRLALQGSEVAMGILDPKIHPIIGEIRKQIDALSAQLRSMGVIAGDLAAVVEGNEGTYLTTTYRAFQGPKWAEDVPQEIKNAYADFVRKEFPNKTNEEINGIIDKILYDAEQSGSPMAMAKKAQLGAKDVSILTRKKDLPDELKALLGEEEDPILN